MDEILVVLRSLWAWFSISMLILFFLPVMAVVWLFDRDPGKYATGRVFRRLGSLMVTFNPAWKVHVTGEFPGDLRNPYVVVCNHQSLADIPIVSRLPWDMKWVGKASLFNIPVIGWMMKLARDIPVRRGDRRSRAQVMIDIKQRLMHNVSVMVMPEGTRSKDGRVGVFNDGAFKLALKMNLPVLPIALDGAFDALPKDGWKFGSSSKIQLHVLDPVMPEDWDNGTEMCAHVRGLIISRIARWREVPTSEIDRLETGAGFAND